jgi:hypothetical protein
MDGDDDHATLYDNLKPKFDEIDELEGKLFTPPNSDTPYRIRLFLSGDWKFLRIVTGMAAPSAKNHVCVWCKCLKEKIADMSRTWDIDRSERERRSVIDNQGTPITPAVANIELPPVGPPRWPFVSKIVNDCNLAAVVKPMAKDYHLSFPGDKKAGIVNKTVAMMKCWEAEGERGDDAAKRRADLRIHTMCVNMAIQLAAYVRNRQPVSKATNYGYLREGLLPNIPFDRIILDVLHCFLRVYDVLFSLLVEGACRVGTTCLARLQAEVSGNCGVTRFEFSYGDYDADKERRKADPMLGRPGPSRLPSWTATRSSAS